MNTNYAACGTLTDGSQSYMISGIITIDITLRLWSGPSNPAPPAPLPVENNQYSFFIPSYSLYIYSFDHPKAALPFKGTAGCFYIERTDNDLGDLQWFLENGTGSWQSWMGEELSWYKQDQDDYDMFNQLSELAPLMRLAGLQIPPNDPIFSQQARCEIILAKLELCRRLFS